MLGSVNNVSFNELGLRNKQSFQRRVDNPIDSANNGRGVSAGGLLTAAAIVTGLVVGHKTGAFSKLGKMIPETVKNSKLVQWVKEPAKKVLGKLNQAGGWLSTKGQGLLEYGKNAFNTVKGFAKKYGAQVWESAKKIATTVGKFVKEKGSAVLDFAKKIFVKK